MLDDATARQTTCSVLGRSGAARHPDDLISRRVRTVAVCVAILPGCPAPGGPRYHVSSGSNTHRIGAFDGWHRMPLLLRSWFSCENISGRQGTLSARVVAATA